MVTLREIRAARALLGWSQQQLADKAIVSLNAVARLERGEVDALVADDVKEAARNRVFGFEILSAPFVIAHWRVGKLARM